MHGIDASGEYIPLEFIFMAQRKRNETGTIIEFYRFSKTAGAMFGKEDFHPLYGAPTLILISSKQTMPHMANVMYSNAAIMSHNISLAATELNIGSCYIWGATASISDNETIIKELNLPDGFVPCCAVCLGKTNEIFEEREIPNRISKTFIK